MTSRAPEFRNLAMQVLRRHLSFVIGKIPTALTARELSRLAYHLSLVGCMELVWMATLGVYHGR